MPQYKKKQTVQLFGDSSIIVNQSVSIDTDEKWINVIHHGEELSMSLKNWYKMLDLFKQCETLIPKQS